MSEPESTLPRRFVWPAEYYSGPTPAAVLPRGVTFGCGAASLAALLLIFAGGAFLGAGGFSQFLDLALGMSMGDVRGMYASEVTAAQKKELEDSIEQVRQGLRDGKVSVTELQPTMELLRKSISDKKLTPAEVEALSASARKAAAAKPAPPAKP